DQDDGLLTPMVPYPAVVIFGLSRRMQTPEVVLLANERHPYVVQALLTMLDFLPLVPQRGFLALQSGRGLLQRIILAIEHRLLGRKSVPLLLHDHPFAVEPGMRVVTLLLHDPRVKKFQQSGDE